MRTERAGEDTDRAVKNVMGFLKVHRLTAHRDLSHYAIVVFLLGSNFGLVDVHFASLYCPPLPMAF